MITPVRVSINLMVVCLFAGRVAFAQAQDKAPSDTGASTQDSAQELEVQAVHIVSTPLDVGRVAGSAHVIDQKAMETFEYDDAHRVLQQVPGVYVRSEDGFGLRPNIGLRGVSSDRSSKVTLMEDGILLAPAPYAAPAAYYFPITTRMVGVDVYKGPGALRFGPNTIGGALNWKTKEIPEEQEANVDLALGLYQFGKLHGNWGFSTKHYGLLVEAVHLRSGGFKELDNGGDTGFEKNEVMVKGRWNSDPYQGIYHELGIKFGYADEVSNETYLGLSAEDFAANSLRRYAASQLGLMDWTRRQFELSYDVDPAEQLHIRTTAYRHDFSRAWRKLNRFRSGPDLNAILSGPSSGQNAVYYAVLRGEQDSLSDEQALMIGTNDRDYVSQGVQVVSELSLDHGVVRQDLELGVRLHYDSVKRHHDELAYRMQQGLLVLDGSDPIDTARNQGTATAWAFHLLDQIHIAERWLVAPGIRAEFISTEYTDDLNSLVQEGSSQVVLPGIGSVLQLPWHMNVVAGVHAGFSPVSPGQPDAIRPERSVNYEAGLRFERGRTKGELIGFFNDYSNLLGECTFTSGCDESQLNQQFNAGAVHVYGLESLMRQRVDLPWNLALDVAFTYTLTLSSFQNSFTSSNPLYGQVEEGDHLPYVPEHQGNLSVGLDHAAWSINTTATYVGRMRDVASQGEIAPGEGTDSYLVFDAVAAYHPDEHAELYLRLENLFDNRYVASLRPFGARPGKPFSFVLGYKHHFR